MRAACGAVFRKESDTKGKTGFSERRWSGLWIGVIRDRNWMQEVDVSRGTCSAELLVLSGCCSDGRLRVRNAAFCHRLVKGIVTRTVVAGILLRCGVEEA
jgi:hypothetical protein